MIWIGGDGSRSGRQSRAGSGVSSSRRERWTSASKAIPDEWELAATFLILLIYGCLIPFAVQKKIRVQAKDALLVIRIKRHLQAYIQCFFSSSFWIRPAALSTFGEMMVWSVPSEKLGVAAVEETLLGEDAEKRTCEWLLLLSPFSSMLLSPSADAAKRNASFVPSSKQNSAVSKSPASCRWNCRISSIAAPSFPSSCLASAAVAATFRSICLTPEVSASDSACRELSVADAVVAALRSGSHVAESSDAVLSDEDELSTVGEELSIFCLMCSWLPCFR